MKYYLIAFCVFICSTGIAQTFPVREKVAPAGFQKKFVWGFTFSQYWSTITGSPGNYFAKPSSGISVSAEYYPLTFLGFGIAAGYQQRGAGVMHHYIPPTPSDSSFRERLRFNTIEIPISIILRTPKDLLRGFRLGGSVAVVPMINLHSHDVLNVVEPSTSDADVVKDVSASYFKNDVAYQFTVGPEFNCGSGIFKVHFAYSMGTANVYKTGQSTGHNQTLGVRLSALF